MGKARISAESFIRRTAVVEFLAAALSLVLSLSQLPERSGLPLVFVVYLALAQAGYGGWLIMLRSRYQDSGRAPASTRTFTVLLCAPSVLGVLGCILLMLRYPPGHGIHRPSDAVLLSVGLLVLGANAAMLCVFRAQGAACAEPDAADL
jgi:hypothetical protein